MKNTKTEPTVFNHLKEFQISRGGPFYQLQNKISLITDDSWRTGLRTTLFIVITWGVPLLLSLLSGSAFGDSDTNPFLLDYRAYVRYLVVVGIFIWMEPRIEESLVKLVNQFFEAPMIAAGALEKAAIAIKKAVTKRNSIIAEVLIFVLAIVMAYSSYLRAVDADIISWVYQLSQNGVKLSPAGLWSTLVSNSIFWFLVIRWLWRLLVWSLFISKFASLDLRLVVTHPDGYGGLSFVSQYPNAFTPFIFGISSVLGVGIAHMLQNGTLEIANYGYFMSLWLAVILLLFTIPLISYTKPLSELKKNARSQSSAQATMYHRALEREHLGKNIAASMDVEDIPSSEINDPSKEFSAAEKMSTILIRREVLLPLSAAALIPLALAGVSLLPIKELFGMLKKLLLL